MEHTTIISEEDIKGLLDDQLKSCGTLELKLVNIVKSNGKIWIKVNWSIILGTG